MTNLRVFNSSALWDDATCGCPELDAAFARQFGGDASVFFGDYAEDDLPF